MENKKKRIDYDTDILRCIDARLVKNKAGICIKLEIKDFVKLKQEFIKYSKDGKALYLFGIPKKKLIHPYAPTHFFIPENDSYYAPNPEGVRHPDVMIRLNTQKISDDEIQQFFEDGGLNIINENTKNISFDDIENAKYEDE